VSKAGRCKCEFRQIAGFCGGARTSFARRLVLAELNVDFFDSVLRNSPDVVVVHVWAHLNFKLMGYRPSLHL
jgi:hypothetical protein